MKSFRLCMLSLIFFAGCAPTMMTFAVRDYEVGREKFVTPGTPIMTWGWAYNPEYGSLGFIRRLIYTGMARGEIHIQYCEYDIFEGEKYIRPAFTSDLHYDFALNCDISFRGAVVKIDSANQSGIYCAVIQEDIIDFPAPESRMGIMVDSAGTVLGVREYGWAWRAEIMVGDTIIAVDGHPVVTGDSESIVRQLDEGRASKANLTIRRQGAILSIKVNRR